MVSDLFVRTLKVYRDVSSITSLLAR